MPTTREKDIKLLVAKFVKLVESLDPGERLSIRKIGAGKSAKAKKGGKATTGAKTAKTKKAKTRAAN
jgi:hypothetical protein